ncbi:MULTISPECIES: GIY-YIG nuclease family protein [Oxalobacteraceae]|uniref:GIY-YIG nuclease family protein n=1 Tax=Herminiimonas sp. Marseille-P9896 TaxID=2742211 RepID=UPI00158E8FE0|nr:MULTISPECIES: GIY-YIG nuclease family protein [Oxalobacteraceae]
MATNKFWKDDFNPNDYDDIKSAEVERERLRQENSTTNWIYVGTDIRHFDEAKIGLTSGALGTRASSSQNPHFTLLCAFKVKDGITPLKLAEIEESVKTMLCGRYEAIPHYGSRWNSEWFRVSPQEMREVVQHFLYDNYNWYMYSYYCHERDEGVINGWENTRLINGGDNLRYGPRDLSTRPIAFECLTFPGCGEDCDCW